MRENDENEQKMTPHAMNYFRYFGNKNMEENSCFFLITAEKKKDFYICVHISCSENYRSNSIDNRLTPKSIFFDDHVMTQSVKPHKSFCINNPPYLRDVVKSILLSTTKREFSLSLDQLHSSREKTCLQTIKLKVSRNVDILSTISDC